MRNALLYRVSLFACLSGACSGDEPKDQTPITSETDTPGRDSTPLPSETASDTSAEPTTAETGSAETGNTAETANTGDTAATPPLVPDPFDADFLWATLLFDDAVDLGFIPSDIAIADQVEPGPVTLTEIGVDAGLGLSVCGGNSHGVGIGWFDADGDGWEDIFAACGISTVTYPSSLWHNNGDGTFTDVSASAGVADALLDLDTYSVSAADYDADGDLDIYVTAHPTSVLLQNEAGVFTDVTTTAGAQGLESAPDPSGSSKIGAWGDYDGDGWMDIVVASSTFLDSPSNGYLLRNQGDGTFADVTDITGYAISGEGNPCAVLWTDYDNDGDVDLNIWNDRGVADENRTLLRNDAGLWSDVTIDANMTNSMGNPMGIDGADVDRNGYLDYYIGNIGGNALLMGQSNSTFIDFALSSGVQAEYSWGLSFEDFDADSWWDIFVAEEDSRPYLTFTHNRDIPPTFTEQQWLHPDVASGHNIPVAFADFDHDNDVDVISSNTAGERLHLFRNDTDRGTNHFLEVEVANSPGIGEYGGITGRVVVKVGDVVLWRDITGGSSRASQNSITARFGLGQRTGADWVAVLWPDGRQLAAYNVPGDSRLTLEAP